MTARTTNFQQNDKFFRKMLAFFEKVWYNYSVMMWKRIEVVITGLTRNQLYFRVPRVRIPPLPPTGNARSKMASVEIQELFLCLFSIKIFSIQRQNKSRKQKAEPLPFQAYCTDKGKMLPWVTILLHRYLFTACGIYFCTISRS